mmetsp:Transcript_11460/g.10122  ORF Transcript_11460/g.10122 Transcript_11460/m.10122 type:complete len:81 (-) Transcript_11460:570-812(-)
MLEKDCSKRATLEELNIHPFVTDNGNLLPPLEEGKIGTSEGITSTEKPEHNMLNKPLNSNYSEEKPVVIKLINKIWVTKC